ncbi:hypothetical protein [Ruminiclostridium cellobioparum]|jgi:hypothetical protein|uniref:Uncharacterized protein n=1 Tax=Ruminiclostridium cellobioparum subsp. termitidis CT1112 TaxID=1195236 RepID=S0FH36_RUMCE|nr:hypothetical protein [Ruminiclostridium cellobioparum]EMS69121.1 hypothetical protein CTER_5279 [Ruminiclostridium cellobioparum subsp. termitidis CT1112]
MRGSVLENLTWEGNSKKMFALVMDAVPSIFSGLVKHEIEDWIVKNNVNVVTEDLCLKMFKEKAPKGMIEKLTPKLESLKTK